jgi:hypothetical protein
MRNREAWLAAIAAALGISEEACRHDAAPQIQPVATVAASASAPIVAATASIDVAPSATASATTSAIASASAAPSTTALPNKPPTTNLQEISQAICGAVPQNLQQLNTLNGSCGVSANRNIGRIPGNGACGGSVGPGPNAVRGPVAAVTVTLTGGATGDDRVAASLRPRFRACANQALSQDPSMQGKLLVTATIAANGEVQKADITNNQGLSPAASQCMIRGVKNAQFNATGAARTVTLLVVQTIQSP